MLISFSIKWKWEWKTRVENKDEGIWDGGWQHGTKELGWGTRDWEREGQDWGLEIGNKKLQGTRIEDKEQDKDIEYIELIIKWQQRRDFNNSLYMYVYIDLHIHSSI